MRGVRIALIVVLASAGAAACTSADGNPSPTHSFSTATQPSYSVQSSSTTPNSTSPSVATTGPNVKPGEKPPTLLDAGKQDTPLGAVAYARFWYATLDWSYATMDTSLAHTLFASSCAGCANFLKNSIELAVSKHEVFNGGRLADIENTIQPTDHHDGATAVVDSKIVQDAFTRVDANGHDVAKQEAATASFRTWLKWTSTGWTIVDWKHVVAR